MNVCVWYSCGDIFGFHGEEEAFGYLGNFEVKENGITTSLQIVSDRLNLPDIIGRSVVVSKGDQRLNMLSMSAFMVYSLFFFCM